MDATRWTKGRNPYYADVVLDPSRLSDIVEGAGIPGVKDTKHGAELLPEDLGPAPDQVSEAAFETGGRPSPK